MNSDEKIALTLADLKVALKDLSKNIADAAPPKDVPPVPPSLDKVKIESQGPDMGNSKTKENFAKLIKNVLVPEMRAGDQTDPRATLQATQKTTVIATKQLDYLKKQFNIETKSGKDMSELVNRIKERNQLANDQYNITQSSGKDIESLTAGISEGNRLATDQYNITQSSGKGIENLAAGISEGNRLANDQYNLSESSSTLLGSLDAAANRLADEEVSEPDINLDPLQSALTSQAETAQAQYDVSMNTNTLLTALKETGDMQLYTAQDAEERLKTEKQVVQQAQGVVIQDIDKDAAGVLSGIFGKLKGLFGKKGKAPPTKKEEDSWLWNLLAMGAMNLATMLAGPIASLVKNALLKVFEIGGKILKGMWNTSVKIAKWAAKGIKKGLTKAFEVGKNLLKKSWNFAKNLATKTGSAIKKGLGKAFDVAKNVLSKSWNFAKNLVTKTGGAIKKGLGKAFDVGKNLLSKSWNFAKNLATKSAGAIKSGLGKAFNVGKNLLSKSFGFAKDLAIKAATKIKGGLGKAFSLGKGIFGKFFGAASRIAIKAAGKMKGGLAKAFNVGKGLLSKIPGIGKGLAKIGASAGSSVLGAVKGSMPKGGGLLKSVGKLAKFAGPIGGLVAGGMAVFDGVGAAMDEYKKSGSITAAAREGVASGLSSLTFGLVDQETFSGAFSAIGDGVSSAASWVGDRFGNLWDGVTSLAEGNISDAVGAAGEYLTFGLVDSETISNFASDVGDTLSDAGDWLSEGASSVWGSVTGFFSNSPDVWDVFDDSGKTLGEGAAKVAESTAKVAKDAKLHAETTEEQSTGLGSMVGDLFMNFTPLGIAGKVAAKGVGGLIDGVKGLFSDSDDEMSDADKDMRDEIRSFVGKIFDWFDEAIEELEERERKIAAPDEKMSWWDKQKASWGNKEALEKQDRIKRRDERDRQERQAAEDAKWEKMFNPLENVADAMEDASSESLDGGMLDGMKSAELKLELIKAAGEQMVSKLTALCDIQQQQLSILEMSNLQRAGMAKDLIEGAKSKEAPTIINNSTTNSNATTLHTADPGVMTNFRNRVHGYV